MNNFTSTCSQIVTSSTCTGVLNPLTYNGTSLIKVNTEYYFFSLLFTM